MADLKFYARLPKLQMFPKHTSEDLKKVSWNPDELVQLKRMDRTELLGLMTFCDIRVYEEYPVIACEDDELRMAYLSWRSYHSASKRTGLKKRINKAKKSLFTGVDEIIDSLTNHGR